MSENIGIFGGSFDPVHLGHERLAAHAVQTLRLDRLIVIPTAVSPFKKRSSEPADRLAMCRLAFPERCYCVSDIEVLRGGTSYTVDTVTELAGEYPSAKLFMIIGSDQLLSFNKWYRWRDILKLVTVCAVSRDGDSTLAQLQAFADAELRPYGDVRTIEFEPFEISSTQIRACAASDGDITPFVSPAVAEYIISRGLYSDI